MINEFFIGSTSSQWIELYNSSDSIVDIGNWILDDEGGSQNFVIPEGTQLQGKSYQVFESSLFNLNKSSADIVRLIHNGNIEDSYGYTTGPPVGASVGRGGWRRSLGDISESNKE